ncbi:YggS family pyridoxal phosphate-dependent enzyme [soil metagenome]
MTGLETQALDQRVLSVRQRIAGACHRAGREPTSVTLVAVSKTVGREEIDLAYNAGIRDFGENRIQPATQKFAEPMPLNCRLHMIGHLQSNKTGTAVQLFDMIHSVDRVSLIEQLQRQAAMREKTLNVLLQVNIARETQKTGCDRNDAYRLALQVAQASELNLLGLMTMAPLVDEPESVRPVFRELTRLRDTLSANPAIGALPILSMGMTNDFETAIEEGATHVRIGRAIFESHR